MAVESHIYGLWAGRQASKGSPVTEVGGKGTATKRLIQVGGDLDNSRADGAEAFSDLDFYGNMTDFANTLIGNGAPVIEAQSDTTAFLANLMFGNDVAVEPKYEASSANPQLPVQTIKHWVAGEVTGGTFTLQLGAGTSASTTVPLPFNASKVEIELAFLGLKNLKACNSETEQGKLKGVKGAAINSADIEIEFGVGQTTLGNVPILVNTTGLTGPAVPASFRAAMTVVGKLITHTTTSSNAAGGYWSTWFKRLGGSSVVRQRFHDCKMGGMVLEGSTANKVCRVTSTLVALEPGVVFGGGSIKKSENVTLATLEENNTAESGNLALATKEINLGNVPFIYTEGAGAYIIDGQAFHGHTQFNIAWDLALTPVYGDEVTPYDLVPGQAKVTLSATLILDTASYEQYCRIIYGTAKPAVGTSPIEHLPAMGSYELTLRKVPLSMILGGMIVPTGVSATVAGSGGTFAGAGGVGTYRYAVTAVNEYGETLASQEVSAVIAVATEEATVKFNLVPNATKYRLYRSKVNGAPGEVGAGADAAGMVKEEAIAYTAGGTGTIVDKGVATATKNVRNTPPNAEELKCVVPAVHWNPGLALPPNPSGGVIDLAFAGEMRKQQGQAGTTLTLVNPDPKYA
jgi:hypothetical protein